MLMVAQFSPRGDREQPSVLGALLVGVAQGFAVLPGLSRSGSTIAVLLWLGVRPERAFTLSMLMSLPAVFGAVLLESRHAFAAAISGRSRGRRRARRPRDRGRRAHRLAAHRESGSLRLVRALGRAARLCDDRHGSGVARLTSAGVLGFAVVALGCGKLHRECEAVVKTANAFIAESARHRPSPNAPPEQAAREALETAARYDKLASDLAAIGVQSDELRPEVERYADLARPFVRIAPRRRPFARNATLRTGPAEARRARRRGEERGPARRQDQLGLPQVGSCADRSDQGWRRRGMVPDTENPEELRGSSAPSLRARREIATLKGSGIGMHGGRQHRDASLELALRKPRRGRSAAPPLRAGVRRVLRTSGEPTRRRPRAADAARLRPGHRTLRGPVDVQEFPPRHRAQSILDVAARGGLRGLRSADAADAAGRRSEPSRRRAPGTPDSSRRLTSSSSRNFRLSSKCSISATARSRKSRTSSGFRRER